ncbi:hypothetical protein [Herbaspirillum sp. RV1423]|uniref:hypothetical protein n=1 Tax=Herbaspirillum sp. RV1423 TaxID=1443993 RepID=UPI0012DF2EA1|nr:hypothetical protein [Herbaspirillum sp. RV1423]
MKTSGSGSMPLPDGKRPADCTRMRVYPVTLLTYLILEKQVMGKYFLAWILGVPAFALVLIYLFAH